MSTKKVREKDPFAKCAIGLRKKLKLTKTAVAKHLKVSRQTIVVWDLKRSIPLGRRAKIIAKLRERAREYAECADKLELSTQSNGGTDEA